MPTADWWRSAVIYQIYPRSFADGNGDGTGDLAGARSRLPYLHDLGVDAVWLTPWYLSPLADGGYDVADYRQIDPAFGDLAQAEAFIREAADLGIRTIIDIVPNHISSAHEWFQAALAAGPGAPERERFWFRPGRGPGGDELPTNWVSSFQGSTWTRTTNPDGTPGDWYLHLFTPEQPDLNWNHPDVRAEHEAVLKFWFDRGVAGIRIDSAAVIIKDPDLPEVPSDEAAIAPGAHPFIDRDAIHEVYRSWRRIADSYDPPRVLVGEIWLPDTQRFAAYLGDQEMHTAFNFDFMAQPWSASALRQSIQTTLAAHASVGAPTTWVLSNHDVTRPVTRYGREDTSFAFLAKRFGTPTDLELGTRRARAACLITAALPGCLYLYQGDELGLPEDEELPLACIQDPMHFRSGGVDPGRDGCRVPLPWTSEPAGNFGFSDSDDPAPAWLPQPQWWGRYGARAQADDPASMLALYRDALRLRRASIDPEARLEWLSLGEDVIAFARGQFACIANLSTRAVDLPAAEVLLSSRQLDGHRLEPDCAVWLHLPQTNSPQDHRKILG